MLTAVLVTGIKKRLPKDILRILSMINYNDKLYFKALDIKNKYDLAWKYSGRNELHFPLVWYLVSTPQ